jgi:hypothetical protein
MSEMGEMFREIRKERQERNHERYRAAPGLLLANGISFTCKDDGYHLIIQVADQVIDFWPSTGHWACRPSRKRGSGIDKLIAHHKALSAQPAT